MTATISIANSSFELSASELGCAASPRLSPILILFSRDDFSQSKLSRHRPKPRLSAKNLFPQADKLTQQAIMFSHQFSVGPSGQGAGEGLLGQVLRDLTQLRQGHWADAGDFQPLVIRHDEHVANRWTTPAELKQDRISHLLGKSLNRERIIQLHLTPHWLTDEQAEQF
jgi:hypothetical protein